jgi:hypothetical protein
MWVNPLRAGNSCDSPTGVVVAGSFLVSGDLNLAHNSPDLNGDGVVNLSDLSIFADDYYGGYMFRSDFHYDGSIDLNDLAKFASSWNAACP